MKNSNPLLVSLLFPPLCPSIYMSIYSLLPPQSNKKEMEIFGENVPSIKAIDCFLRLFVIPLSIVSIWLIVTNKEDNIIYGTLDFTNLKGLKYIVWVSAISGGYALVAAISLWVKILMNKAWFFFVSDQVVAYLMVTSGAAMAEIIYLAYNGDKSVTWSEACSSYGKFCSRMNIILILQAIALFCFFFLAVISAYRAFSTFDPPFVNSKEVEEEMT